MNDTNVFGGELTIDQIIAEATPLERVIHVCVDGALQAEFDEAERALVKARRAGKDTAEPSVAEGDHGVREAAHAVEDVRGRMEAHTYPFRFRAPEGHRTTYVALIQKASTGPEIFDKDGKPVFGVDGKQNRGLDVDVFVPELLAATCVAPKMTVEQAREFVAKLRNDVTVERLVNTAKAVSVGAVDVPFSRLASLSLDPPKPSQPADSPAEPA